MYSQNQEEEILINSLPKEGRLLDIGAHDGIQWSNSRALIEQGWKGVLVEPSPVVFVQLMANTDQFRDSVELANMALTSGNEDIITFYDSMGDGISGYDEAHLIKWKKPMSWRPMFINLVNVKKFLKMVGYEFDFVNIDTEGTNWEILTAIPWSMMPKVQMVCVEYDDKAPQMTDFMKDNGFILVHRNGENLIFQRNA
jgi:FkbM family methyltransferase